ncbi:MAG: class I SAM-dependent methyltransferase [Cyanobacteria bacterium P01_D01_bin.123]
MMLSVEKRSKLDESDDTYFYDVPRFVNHVDNAFIMQLTELYRQILPTHGHVFDMMSSWVSHLPAEMEFAEVVGHGMNEEELARNPRLDRYFMQNLNQKQLFPLEDSSFDAVLNAVSVQYLQYPEAIFAEIWRVLKPGGVAIVSFSNRMFYQKAIQVWRDGSDASHVQLVCKYFESVPGFDSIEVAKRTGRSLQGSTGFLSFLRPPNDPFFAVIARKAA